MRPEGDPPAASVAETVARRSYGKLIAFLAARTRDVVGAEDALSDAFAAALVNWASGGVPDNPEGWLLAVARRKMIDAARQRGVGAAAQPHLQLLAEELEAMAGAAPQIPDERLALMFACAHPAIEPGIRAPLILQAILGFDAQAIGSAFLVSPAAMGQRLARAKHKIRRAGIPFRTPERADMRERLEAVLEAVYAAYTEGWSDPAGVDVRLRDLAEEAIWLGRLIVELLPDEPEALGLLALMLYSQARRGARRDSAGEFVPLAAQDPALWDQMLIDEAEALLFRAADPTRSAAISSRRRSSRPMSCAGAAAARTGRRSNGSMTGSARSPARRWPRSTARSRWRKRVGPPKGSQRCPSRRLARGSRIISRTGPRARSCWRGSARARRRERPMTGRSGWRQTRRSGGSCRSGGRRRIERSLVARTIRPL